MEVTFGTGMRLKRACQKAILFASLACAVALPCSGQQALNLKRALALTLVNNMELQAYPLAIRGSEAMQSQADLRPNPVLGVEVENVFGTGNYQNFDTAEISLSLSQLIELGDKRDNRMRFAKAETQKLKAEFEILRLDVLAETGRRYYDALALQEQQEWIRLRVISENEALKIIQLRAQAGAVGKADVSKMALRLARSKALEQQLSSELNQANLRLAAMWMSQPKYTRLVGSLATLPAVPDSQLVSNTLANFPGVLNHQALQRLADSRLKLAQSKGVVDMSIGLGIKQHQLTKDQSLSINFSMPLAITNTNSGQIQAAQVALDKSEKQSRWYQQQLKLTLIEIQQHLISLQERAKVLKQELLPLSNELLVETQRGYLKGRYSVLQWVDAQSELFSIKQSIIKTHQLIHLQFLELERITGQPMSKIGNQLVGEKL
jgi:cobalt-zinc-cadmium efflux system outer membrane protein